MKRLIILCLLISVLCPLARADYINKPLMGSQIDRSHPLSRSLVGCWFADGSNMAFDYTRNGNNGTFVGDTHNVPGAKGYAWNFDGTGDYIDCGNNTNFNMTSAMTILAWVYFPADLIGFNSVVGKEKRSATPEAANYWLFLNSSGKLGFYVKDIDGDSTSLVTTDALQTGQWYQVAVTFLNGSVNLYINGALSEAGNLSVNTLIINDADLEIGSGQVAGGARGHYFKGLIDDVKIYNRALTPEEIRRLYMYSFCMFEDE